jgi:hypothetical protein
MLHAASQDREVPLFSLQGLAEEPELLERGLKVVDVGLRLAPGFVLDLILVDRTSRPVVVLGEGSGGPEALLGRGVCVLAEVRRMWSLLDRVFTQEGVTFGADPRLILVARRFSDALHGAADLLAPLAIELVEAREVTIEGVKRIVAVRVGGAPPSAAPQAGAPPPPENGAPAHAAAPRTRRAAERAEPAVDDAKKNA